MLAAGDIRQWSFSPAANRGMSAPEQSRLPKYDLGAFPVYTDTTWNEYGGGEGAEYLGTMIISRELAGEHRVPRVNNPIEVSVVEINNGQ